jgi:putative FmdB family regulatory protein
LPIYEFRCSTCHAVFDERRPMVDADAPATCSEGHVGARRLLPVFATTGLAAGGGWLRQRLRVLLSAST